MTQLSKNELIEIILKLEAENKNKDKKIDELYKLIQLFQEQSNLEKHKKFCSSSEKSECEQLLLFDEAELYSDIETPEPILEEITYTRQKKKKGHRDEMFDGLPVETIEYTLPEEELICDSCSNKLHEMSKEIRREVKIIPAQVKVVEHACSVYGCRGCEKNGIEATIKKAPMPKSVIPNSFASASAVAYVMNDKFVKGLPLYRQEQDWERLGICISRQTMANWMILSSERFLSFVYERMKEHLVTQDIIHADETKVQVLHEPERKASDNSFMWLYRSGREGPHIVLYDYQMTRGGKHPEKFLEEFEGYLNVDGYPGYNNIPDTILVGCWAHARRKFHEAIKAKPPNKENKITASDEGLIFCDNLFKIEKTIKDASIEERHRIRNEQSLPLINKFKEWLNRHALTVLPKSMLGKAITYCINQMPKLENFLLDGRLEIDNNRAERSIKPFVIGRKAWLFSNTPKGANASAKIYSVVETAKENDLNPFMYLTYLLERLPNIDLHDKNIIDELLPWSNKLPDSCYVKKKT